MNLFRKVLLVVMLISAIWMVVSFCNEKQSEQVYEDVKQYEQEVIIQEPEEETTVFDQTASYQMSYDWDSLLKENNEIVGWLYVPGNEKMNFPVTKGTNNKFYLNRNYKKQYDPSGTAFLDCKNDEFDLCKIVYGHNMNLSKSKPIFSSIMNWKDESYFNAHRELYFTEAYGKTTKYLIAGIAHFNIANEDEFSYLDTKFQSEEEMRNWIEYIKSKSSHFDLAKNTIDYRANEVLIASTCDSNAGKGGKGRTILFCINLTNNQLDELERNPK